MSMWLTQIQSLATRRAPTSDEIRDAHNAQVKSERLKAIKAGKYRQELERWAETEQQVFAVVKKVGSATIDDLKAEIGVAAYHLRQVATKMVEDGRLEVIVGQYGKKFWKVKGKNK